MGTFLWVSATTELGVGYYWQACDVYCLDVAIFPLLSQCHLVKA